MWGRLCQFLLSFIFTPMKDNCPLKIPKDINCPMFDSLKILEPYIPSSKVPFSRIFGKYIVWINWKSKVEKLLCVYLLGLLLKRFHYILSGFSIVASLRISINLQMKRPLHTSKMKTLQTSVPFGRPINQPEQSIRIQICFIITFCDALRRVVECRVHL